MTLTFLKSIGHEFCRMSLNLGLSLMFSHDWTGVINIWEEDPKGEVPFS